MVTTAELSWQNTTIPPRSDFRGVLTLGLLVAWGFFIWQACSLPAGAHGMATLPPLLAFTLAKGRFMPDFGLIIAGCVAFHTRRELAREWNSRLARKVYLRAVLPLLAYLALGVLLIEGVHLLGPSHKAVLPWLDPLVRVQFLIILPLLIVAFIWPLFLHWLWICDPSVSLALCVLGLFCYALAFHVGTHQLLWMWPPTALFDFAFGASFCAMMLRSIAVIAPVRGPMIILGWMVMLGSSILEGPGLFLIGFLMILGGAILSERTWFLPGERALLLWSHTALAIALTQPAVLAAWMLWEGRLAGISLAGLLAAAAVTQLLAVGLTLIIAQPARRLGSAIPA